MMADLADAHVHRRRDAVRILHILDAAGEPVGRRRSHYPQSTVKILKAEKRLQALDFWVRNPDYLAHEMLELYVDRGDNSYLALAEEVMSGNEPDIRRLGMLRFFFGAFERVDDAIANLKTFGLVDVLRELSGDRVVKREYILLQAGADKAAELAKDDVLRWYADRAALVARVAGARSANALKKAQYGIEKYENARYGEIIAPITEEVRERLKRLKNSAK